MEYDAPYRTFASVSSYLSKKGRVTGMRRRRYFKLDGAQLSSYKNDKTLVPSWKISVRDCQVTENPDKLSFELILSDKAAKEAPESQRKYFFVADDKKSFELWVNALKETKENNINEFYEITELIGVGSYGIVKKCVDKVTKDVRAVKIIERTGDIQEIEFIRREIEVMRQINFPTLVRTYDIFDEDEKLYIVMDYVGAGDLFEVIASDESFTEHNAAIVMHEVLSGIAYLHKRNIVHRDIKPENILCQSNIQPFKIKITDFGFANVMERKDSSMKSVVGTTFYMAPEIIKKEGHGLPVDLYSCGVVLYAMLSGTLPFEGAEGDSENCFDKILHGNVTFPKQDWEGVSETAKNLIRKLLNTNPDDRPTAEEALKDDWFDIIEQEPSTYSRLASDLTRLKVMTTRATAEKLHKKDDDQNTVGDVGVMRGSAAPVKKQEQTSTADLKNLLELDEEAIEDATHLT